MNYKINTKAIIMHADVPMARIEWMGNWAPVPVPVAEAIAAKHMDPKLYRVHMSGGVDLNNGCTARLNWMGGGVNITPEIAQAILDDCTCPMPQGLTAEIGTAFELPKRS